MMNERGRRFGQSSPNISHFNPKPCGEVFFEVLFLDSHNNHHLSLN